MFSWLTNAWRVPELRHRVLFTAMILGFYRLGSWIPVPGVNSDAIDSYFSGQGGTILGLLNIFSGGALGQFALFALGIMPYVTASIILQLMTVVIPRLEQLQKEGEAGYAKINQYTRYLTVVLAALQAAGYSYLFNRQIPDFELNSGRFVLIVVSLTAATTLLMPHEERGRSGQRDDDEDEAPGVQLEVGDLTVEEVRVPRRLERREDDGQVPRVLVDLRVAGLALLLQLLEPRDHHGHQLEDDRGRDVGHDPEREQSELPERAAREDVQEAENGPALAGEVRVDGVRVDAGHRDPAPQPVEAEDHRREEHAMAELRDPPGVRQPGEHLFGLLGICIRGFLGRTLGWFLGRCLLSALGSLGFGLFLGRRLRPARLALLFDRLAESGRGPACGLDLLPRRLREEVGGDAQLLLQVALAEDFHVDARVLDEALLDQGVDGDVRAVIEDALEVSHVDRHRVRAVRADGHRVLRIRAALLAEAHVDRHLAALEPWAHRVRAGARLLALDPAAGIAAIAGAHAAADALARLALLRRPEGREVELFFGSRRHLGVLDPHEMADFSEHTEGLRGVLALHGAADLAQAQRPESAPVLLRLADLATRLRDRQLRHLEWSRWARWVAEPPRTPRSSCAGTGFHGRPCRGSGRPLR